MLIPLDWLSDSNLGRSPTVRKHPAAPPHPRPHSIFVARRASTSVPFDPPTEVAELNMGSETEPSWISADLCRLYFHSTRLGTSNVFVAAR